MKYNENYNITDERCKLDITFKQFIKSIIVLPSLDKNKINGGKNNGRK